MTIANHSEHLLKLDLQLFSEDLPDEPNGGVEEVIDPSPVDNEPPATTQEEYDIIKYNSEEVKIPVTERQTYLQKGYNYDKVHQKATDYEQHLNKVAQITGYQSIDELIQAAEQAEQQHRIQQESQRLGINEDAYRQHFEPVNSELAQLKQQLEQMENERMHQQIDREVNDLRSKYEDFEKYEKQVFDTAIEKGYSLEDAYKLVSYEDRINNVARQKEQEVLAQVTGRDGKQVLASNDQPGNTTFDPANMSLADIEKLSERVKRGERITF
ncbi:hypothetical protein [Acinetobacter baumannii]